MKFATAAEISAEAGMLSTYARRGWAASVPALQFRVRAVAYICAADLMGITAGYVINFMLSLAWVSGRRA